MVRLTEDKKQTRETAVTVTIHGVERAVVLDLHPRYLTVRLRKSVLESYNVPYADLFEFAKMRAARQTTGVDTKPAPRRRRR